jgi:hypothetical protein
VVSDTGIRHGLALLPRSEHDWVGCPEASYVNGSVTAAPLVGGGVTELVAVFLHPL